LVPFKPPSWFSLFSNFCWPPNNIKVLGIHFGSTSFVSSSFLQAALEKDVHHIEVLPRLGDVQVTFGIFFQCFAQRLSYLLCSFPPFWALDINLWLLIQPLWGFLGG
jgi:hypothetical protein